MDEISGVTANAIQEFLLQLKTSGVATILVHHAGKSGDFRGSSKLAATFETIIKLERTAGMVPTCGEAQFRVRWDKVRSGGPKRTVRAVIAKLVTDEPDIFGGPEVVLWVFDETDLNRLDEIRAKLQVGDFVTQKEIGDFFGVSKVMAGKYVEKGKRLGMWDQEDLGRWFAKGKHLRSTGARSAPVKPLAAGDYLGAVGDEGDEPVETTAF